MHEHCLLCGVAWSVHEVDDNPGPLGLVTYVCRIPESKFNELLEFLENEDNWNKREF